MPEAYLVKPDSDFLGRVLDEGGEDLKKCFQCATCSVVCDLSDGKKPFPRKEMIWTQWGLKDKVVADPDVGKDLVIVVGHAVVAGLSADLGGVEAAKLLGWHPARVLAQ